MHQIKAEIECYLLAELFKEISEFFLEFKFLKIFCYGISKKNPLPCIDVRYWTFRFRVGKIMIFVHCNAQTTFFFNNAFPGI